MSLFLITGVPGAGKTTVCNELKRRGFDAYDADEDELAQWFNKETGRPEPEVRTPKFVAAHERNIPTDKVLALARLATPQNPAFICGKPHNEAKLLDLFSGIFALVLDRGAIEHRLASRIGNDWGKKAHELELVLEQHAQSRQTYTNPRYVTLDASRPTTEIADAIIDLVNVNNTASHEAL